MNMIRYQPLGGPLFRRDRGFAGLSNSLANGFGSLGRLHNEINRLFDSYETSDEGMPVADWARADWTPAVDVTEEDKRYVLHADVPGVDPKDIEVTLEEGVLTVRGSRSNEKKEEGNGYRRVERVTGNFFRRFSLPDTADADRISAETKNGVLEVVIPKQPKVEPRRITVKG